MGKNLPGWGRNVRESIALAEDLSEGAEAGLELRCEYRTGDPDLDELTAAVRAERARLGRAERALTEHTAHLAADLVHKRGMSVRDAAALLQITATDLPVAPTRAGRRAS